MKMKKALALGLLSLTMVTAAHAAKIEGTGSSFAYPAYKTWSKAYYDETGNEVNYTPTGSGSGIKEVIARHVDFGGSDKPLKSAALAKAGLIMFPTAIGAVTFAYNIDGVSGMKLSEAAISGIMLGKITYWDDAIIAKNNAGIKLPHEEILFVHRSDKSGTTFAFTYYLSKMNQEWRETIGAKKVVAWPSKNRIAGKGNFGVATAIKSNGFSIGYVDYADAKKNGLDMAIVENREKLFIKPEPASFEAAAVYADLDPKKDFYANIAYPPKGYPMVTATFALVPKEGKNSKEVIKFFEYALTKKNHLIEKDGYVTLPKAVVAKVQAYWVEKGLK
ncbi:MAG: phosphate ABC transporter substrate-binding protein PstS [Piscirickettsiaceae bacterium]|nr:MAG: phosphate ABC transporter substrate-binding protein PstS [Piscirickettsiaceae bacterium]PCI69513.1 MAG: phosphate ABC transporter substrate-binding protein PstS [Piscirickettsiaceae bacterium]